MKRKLLTAGLCLALAALLMWIFWIQATPGAADVDDKRVSITILHTNDIHCRLKADDDTGGGYTLIAAKVKEIRASEENVMLLDAGDAFHGCLEATLSRGKSIVKIMNCLHYDAMVAGNHDFDYGWERLVELSRMTFFPVLSANVRREGGQRILPPHVIRELDGIKVGIFGLTTPATVDQTDPDNVAGLAFGDPLEAAREAVAELRGRCDLLIALVHLSISNDCNGTCLELAQQVKGIDLIISGHDHVALEEGMEINGTCLVQAGELGQCLGMVKFELQSGVITERKAALHHLTGKTSLQADAEMSSLVAAVEKDSEEIMAEVIGWAGLPLDGERSRVRTSQTNLGTLIAEAMQEASGAEAAMLNGGAIRDSIGAGEITMGQVLTVLPFVDRVVVKEITGAALMQALEFGIADYPAENGRFPQVAGMQFSFDPLGEPGQRIEEVSIGGRKLVPEKNYRIALLDFIADGGDGYKMLKTGRVLKEYPSLESIVADYIKKYCSLPAGAVSLCRPPACRKAA